MANETSAFEMWMLRIPWTAGKINEEVLSMMKTKLSLLITAKQRKTAYFGHAKRRNRLQRLLVEGKLNRKGGRGTPRTLRMDNINDWTKLSYEECAKEVNYRGEWLSMIVNMLTADGT